MDKVKVGKEEAGTTLGVVESCRRRDCTRSTRPSWVSSYREAFTREVEVESRCEDAAREVNGFKVWPAGVEL